MTESCGDGTYRVSYKDGKEFNLNKVRRERLSLLPAPEEDQPTSEKPSAKAKRPAARGRKRKQGELVLSGS